MPKETVTTGKNSPRERMKSIMMIWKGKLSIADAAVWHSVQPRVIELWCRMAMAGAKKALKEISLDGK